jgi:hypothetical protein
MKRFPTGMALTELPEYLREKYSMLSACDHGTKIDGLGWRMKSAVWIFEEGDDDEDNLGKLTKGNQEAFIADVKALTDAVSETKKFVLNI